MRKRDTDDLSEEELRQMLIDKRRDARRERLDAFERSGRVVRLVSDSQPEGTHFPTLQAGSEILPAVGRSNPDRRKPGRTVFDRILLLVEILAIAGLVYVVASGAVRFRDLNQQMSNELEQPTPTLLVLPAVVLPDGHTPPVSGGQAQPNEAEIPEVLRPTQAALAVLPTPTESPQQATRIQIPAL
ncbi:MAG TPA: hypothetical protein VF813_10810, partial [Anaerolineaceae bacterium]